MRTLFIAFLILGLVSCSGTESKYEKVIENFLETDRNGVKTDLKIEFLNITVTDIFVSDSITILQQRFENEKSKKVDLAQQSVEYWKKTLEKNKKNRVI